jgi:hypothetical protein
MENLISQYWCAHQVRETPHLLHHAKHRQKQYGLECRSNRT